MRKDHGPQTIDLRQAVRKRKHIIFPVVSAILLVLAFPNFNLEFLAWVAFVPLFYALEKQGTKQRFVTGYVFGIVFFTGVLYWLFRISVPGAIGLMFLLAVAPAIFASLYLQPMTFNLLPIVYVPSAWVATEFLRSHLFTGFPWALLGASQSFNLPLIQFADITGIYGVSFLVILTNFGIYLALRKTQGRFYILFFIFFLFFLALVYAHNRINYPFPTQRLNVAVIQGNIPQEHKWDPAYREHIIEKYRILTREAMRLKPALVVWPETSLPGYLEEQDLKKEIEDLAAYGNVYMILGTLAEEDGRAFNSASLVSPDGKVLKTYKKIHLVPLGEYIPLGWFFSWIRDFSDKPIGDFERGKDHTIFGFRSREVHRGEKEIARTTEFHRASCLICYEDIFPGLARIFVNKGARLLINITNDAWFGKSAAPYQHLQGSVFRAVENRVPVIRAANTGYSCIIDHTGKIRRYVEDRGEALFVDGYIVDLVRPVFTKTIYTRFGDVFSWICCIAVFAGLVVRKTRKT